MLKTATAAILIAATAAPAFAAETESFTRGDDTFVYTKVAGHNQIVLDGRNTTSGETFHLIVAGGRVTGTSNGRPVSFPVSATAADQIAAR